MTAPYHYCHDCHPNDRPETAMPAYTVTARADGAEYLTTTCETRAEAVHAAQSIHRMDPSLTVNIHARTPGT